ncbi:gliding motility lipoprotein GldB [Lacinutrix venerupis]|uniref:Gliding motility lipoprotein GldB n=1 Tax=Lacinutrix venerupis TaxID=1486034 RepID=A0AAC9LNT0_9FLAO|nr:gliding motility lipoprotein GldB [Lacinutrix venerupis]APY01454.1 gliding motility lipoprotein GldB [Lacinutrix venerupis]
MKSLLKPIYLLLILFLTIFSCKKDDKIETEISKINIDFSIERFDKAFAQAKEKDLTALKETFPFMFPKKYNDAFWVEKMKDTLQVELQNEAIKKFENLSKETNEIKSLFKHLKYYFPQFNTPRIITVASDVDYRNKVIVTDSIVVLPLTNYLGKTHYFYQGIQEYIAQDLEPNFIIVDLADKYAKHYTPLQERKTFLEDLIYEGKLLYFKDKVIPFKTNAEKLNYTKDQYNWAQNNEEYIWRYFVDKELLFSTDNKLASRFINPAPFSKFYLEQIDSESPGEIGKYIGWQIVRAYMENNTISFKQMLTKSAEEIFDNAKYKPRK